MKLQQRSLVPAKDEVHPKASKFVLFSGKYILAGNS
jgi:hypothetical protein